VVTCIKIIASYIYLCKHSSPNHKVINQVAVMENTIAKVKLSSVSKHNWLQYQKSCNLFSLPFHYP